MSESTPQHPNLNRLPEPATEPTNDPFDEFSFDDLMQTDMPTTVSRTATPTAAATPEVDFDSLFDFDEMLPITAQPVQSTQPIQSKTLDVINLDTVKVEQPQLMTQDDSATLFGDIAETVADNPPIHHDVTAVDDPFTQPDSLNTPQVAIGVTPPDFATNEFSSSNFSANHPSPTMPETTAINPMDMVTGVGVAGITATTAATLNPYNTVNNGAHDTAETTATPDKEKVLKAKKQTPIKKPILTPYPKKNHKLMPLILGLLVLGGLGAWWFSQMADKTPEPKPVATTPIAKPMPMPVPVAVPISAATVTATSATNVVTTTPTTKDSATTTTASSNLTLIKPEEILANPIPNDPALAKEEMDKLADQSTRLAGQQKMMEDQLRMTKELSDKKAERIALLEQQIAQLEVQKSQSK